MENIKELLAKLNEEQIKPVLDTEGAVLVIAGAGSGKTRVLTTRIAYLVLEKGIPVSRIMAITFTNKAAGEMKERLAAMVGDVNEMWVSTIHSMCVKILRRDIDKIGYDRNFTIYDETDKDKVLKRVFEEKGLDADKLFKTVKTCVSNAKNEAQSPAEFFEANKTMRLARDVAEAYEAYENELCRSNALDFDDILLKTHELFTKRPDIADYYAQKFLYVHIDEFQDTNRVQFEIARRISSYHKNFFAVGDDDQSIYGWRGAKVENILSFEQMFEGAKVYKLERNYRSTKKILGLANRVIAHNEGRRDKELWTDNPDGAKIECFVGTDENNEATYVAVQIKNLMARNQGLTYKDFAVFMRVNALSRAFEQEFTKYGVPHRIFGGFRFFERKEIKDLLSYLKVIVNGADDESFIRASGVPKRGIGAKSLTELREFAAANGESMFEAAGKIHLTSISSGARNKLANFKSLLDSFRDYAESHTAAELIDYIVEITGFNEQFAEKTEENANKLYNISELKNTAVQFYKDNEGATVADYLNSMTLSSDTDEINTDDAVTIATIHAAKGLEYKVVFVAGLDEKILPISRSSGDDGELEEERRLLYVAITRAKERLYLTRAMSRYMYGNREYMSASRFIGEVKDYLAPNAPASEKKSFPEEGGYERDGYGRRAYSYLGDSEEREITHSTGYSSSYAKSFLEGNKPKAQVKPSSFGGYKTGTKVRHAKFGEGTVIEVKGSGDNVIINVAFKGVGIKALSAKYAPLEIIG